MSGTGRDEIQPLCKLCRFIGMRDGRSMSGLWCDSGVRGHAIFDLGRFDLKKNLQNCKILLNYSEFRIGLSDEILMSEMQLKNSGGDVDARVQRAFHISQGVEGMQKDLTCRAIVCMVKILKFKFQTFEGIAQ